MADQHHDRSGFAATDLGGLSFGLPFVLDQETFGDRPEFKSLLQIVTIRAAQEADLRKVNYLESLLYENKPDAPKRGFLLSGGRGLRGFEELLGSPSFLVAQKGERILGFALALPPGHARITGMLASDGLKLKKGLTQASLEPLAWIGKIGVHPDFMGQGIATVFYDALLRQFQEFNVLALTTYSPMRNLPSEALHKKFGFKPAGYFHIGDRGTLQDVVCRIHLRERGGPQ